MLRSVFVAYDDSPAARAALELSASLARALGGKIYLGHIVELPSLPLVTTDVMIGTINALDTLPTAQSPEEIERQQTARGEAARAMLDAACARLREGGIACETRLLTGYVEEELLAQCRGVDLLAVGKGHQEEPGHLGRLPEALAHGSPQPLLVVPEGAAEPDRLVVLMNGSCRAIHALATATELAAATGWPLEVVTAAQESGAGERLMMTAGQYLDDHGVAGDRHAITAEPGVEAALLGWLRERPRALIVMGASGRSMVRQWLAGSTTQAIFKSTSQPVLVCRW